MRQKTNERNNIQLLKHATTSVRHNVGPANRNIVTKYKTEKWMNRTPPAPTESLMTVILKELRMKAGVSGLLLQPGASRWRTV